MSVFIEALIKVLVLFVFLLVTVLLLVWVERKFVSDLQNRVGPDRAGPYGILQTLADGMKAFFKESITPANAQFGLYIAAPIVSMTMALLMFLVIPIGAPIEINGNVYELQVVDLNVAVLYVLAVSSVAVYAITLAGWSSGSKYPMLGSVRASAQMISYEAAMGLALVPVVMFTGSMSMSDIVEAQQGSFLGFLGVWNIILIPSFVIFLISGFAETNRAPFDLVEAEILALEVIPESAWRRHDNVRVLAQASNLWAHLDAADQADRLELVVLAHNFEKGLGLKGDLSCWTENQPPDTLAVNESFHHLQTESSGLARPGLCQTDDIEAFEGLGNHPMLNRCGVFEAEAAKRPDNRIAQAQFRK